MSDNENEYLKGKVQELESDLLEKVKDLELYESQLAVANSKLEVLIINIQNEIKIMGEIQKNLIPVDIPNISGFEFSTKFKPSMIKGGDYFDIFEHKEKFRFGIFLSSSSGYNASSLLLSILFKFGHEIEKTKSKDPHVLIDILKKQLIPAIGEEDVTDLFYGVVDKKRYELQYVILGDIFAVYHSRTQNKVKYLGQDYSAFAKNNVEEIKSEKLSLNEKDRIIICSTGCLESTDLNGESYGVDRLLHSIRETNDLSTVHDVRNHIQFMLEEFSSGQELPRDQTILVSEVKDRMIKLAKDTN